MRRISVAMLALVVGSSGCGRIEEQLNNELRSVAGPWTGTSAPLTLTFQLSEGAGTTVSGSGTMKEAAAAASVPITVTGTFDRPMLSLTINGMVFEGRAVQGTIQGNYVTVGGIAEPLHLTATGYSRDIEILLQED